MRGRRRRSCAASVHDIQHGMSDTHPPRPIGYRGHGPMRLGSCQCATVGLRHGDFAEPSRAALVTNGLGGGKHAAVADEHCAHAAQADIDPPHVPCAILGVRDRSRHCIWEDGK